MGFLLGCCASPLLFGCCFAFRPWAGVSEVFCAVLAGTRSLLQVVSNHSHTESFRLKSRRPLPSWGTCNKSALSLCPQIFSGRLGAECWRPQCSVCLWDSVYLSTEVLCAPGVGHRSLMPHQPQGGSEVHVPLHSVAIPLRKLSTSTS